MPQKPTVSYHRKALAPPAPRHRTDPWKVGESLQAAREKLKLTLRDLSHQTEKLDPAGKGVAHSHIHRIEKNKVVPDLRDIHLLAQALNLDASRVVSPDPVPWFVVRHDRLEAELILVAKGEKALHRLRGNHEYMIQEAKAYRYTTIDAELACVSPSESEGHLTPVMRKYLFEVDYTERETVEIGLDSHDGEEVLWVVDGELEFFYQQVQEEQIYSIHLKRGDSIQYLSKLRHGYRAAKKGTTARALFVYAEPRDPSAPQFVEEH